jgi:hypothetical protein
MDEVRFAAFYERYRAHCIRAGVEPLTTEATLALLAEWHPDGPFSGEVEATRLVAAPKPPPDSRPH